MELMLTGDFMPAKDALALGLLNKVVPAAEVLETAKKLAKKLAGGAPVAQREIMKAIRLGLETNLHEGITKIEKAAFQTLVFTEDFKEGSKAFLEKRPANFKGR
jgi:enoyl-CoA hydratase/carnithine racemase